MDNHDTQRGHDGAPPPDDALSRHYRSLGRETPPAELDAIILAAARETAQVKRSRRTQSQPPGFSPFGGRWPVSLALGMVVVLSVSVVWFAQDESEDAPHGLEPGLFGGQSGAWPDSFEESAPLLSPSVSETVAPTASENPLPDKSPQKPLGDSFGSDSFDSDSFGDERRKDSSTVHQLKSTPGGEARSPADPAVDQSRRLKRKLNLPGKERQQASPDALNHSPTSESALPNGRQNPNLDGERMRAPRSSPAPGGHIQDSPDRLLRELQAAISEDRVQEAREIYRELRVRYPDHPVPAHLIESLEATR